MKKSIIILASVLSLASFVAPVVSLAQFTTPTNSRSSGQVGGGGSPVNATLPNPLKATSLIAVINGLASFMLSASVLIATLLIIFGAFQILTSAGSSDKVESGKKTILYTVVGLGVMLLFKVILAIVAQLLGVNIAPGLL